MANKCELLCPIKEMLNYEYEQTGGLKKRLLAVQLGVQGVRLMVRANTECPARALEGEAWAPSDVCSAQAQELAAKLGPITVEKTTEHQRASFLLADIEIAGLPQDTPPQDHEDTLPPTDEPPKV
jgi:hypothetical protein